MFYLSILLVLVLLYVSTQTATSKTKNNNENLPTRQELWQALRQKGEIMVVYPTANPKLKEQAQQLSEMPSRRTRLVARADNTLTEAESKNNILMLLGAPQSNVVTAKVISELPFQIGDENIQFDGRSYFDPSTVISLPFYPSPLNNKFPVMLITATTDEAVEQWLENQDHSERRFFRWSGWGYELYQKNCRLLMGHFDEKNWQMTKAVHFDYTTIVDTVLQTDHFQFVSHLTSLDSQYLKQVANTCEQSAREILAFTGRQAPPQPITIHLYPSAEDKGLMWSNTNQSHTDQKNCTVHTVLNEDYQDNFIGMENQLLLRQLLGQPKLSAFENGLAVYFTKHWQMKGYDYWSSRLFHSGNMPPLAEILDNNMQAEDSRLVLGCLSASFVEFLIQYWGKTQFLAKYDNWEPSTSEIQELETNWYKFMASKPPQTGNHKTDNTLPYLKGFNFAHEGYNIYNGYISRMAAESLKKQVNLNANATAIIPYSYIPNPQKPSYIGISNSSGSENDESVIHAAYRAKELGMVTMLKPQIWLGRGSWPGDVEMQNEEDWQQFFEHYYRWIRHYALMAEIHRMDILCIGTEFAKATLQREADWRQLIQKIRKLYSGKITYAANWGEEFEQLQFWDELDYIGLDCYYPLSKKDEPTDKELRNNFKAVIKKIEKVTSHYQKPLIFTEIGFRSIDMPWKNPHADEGDAAFNGEHQKRCYQVVFESIQGKDWCQGLFWWKYPTDLQEMGWEQKGFTPNKKPAEAVVKKWFGKLE